jgi:twitching motility protein PilT
MHTSGLVLHDLLAAALAHHASDLHLAVGAPPKMRSQGLLQALPLMNDIVLTSDTLHHMLQAKMSASNWAQFKQGQEIDFSFAVPTLGRFRANAFTHQQGSGVVLRHIPHHIPHLSDLQTPAVLTQLLQQVGLLLVTGPTGSGKSTTLAAMVQHLNHHTRQHIITLEDPIEFVHPSVQCHITQREMGQHSHNFASALRAALRQDPDVLLIGELRDLDTIRLALTAAETGHLVLASLHTRHAAASIERMVDVFDAHEKALVRTQLSDALIGIVSQMLLPVPCAEGQPPQRCAVFETLVATPAIRHLIREGKSAQIQSVLQTGAAFGMQTLAQSLQEAISQQRVRAT